MKIKALRQFPICPDGIKTRMLEEGATLDVSAELGTGLVKAGLAREVVEFYYAELLTDETAVRVDSRGADEGVEKKVRQGMRGTVEATRETMKELKAAEAPATEPDDDDNPVLDDEEDEAEPEAEEKPAKPARGRSRRENKDAGARSRRS